MAHILPRFDFRVAYHAATDTGRRETNEDAYLIEPQSALFAVADGMGGHAAGEVASRLALEEVHRSVSSARSQAVIDAYVRTPSLKTRRMVFTRLRRAIEHANERVLAEGERDAERRGMGTTVDVVWLVRDHAFVAHAGDSRVYLARPNVVLQLTQDHAELEAMKATGLLRAQVNPKRSNRLLNAVGLKETLSVDTLFVDVARGDRILLCTDGVHEPIRKEADLGEKLRAGSAQSAATTLVSHAVRTGRDNATAVVVEIADRFVRRQASDHGMRARDLERARLSPLLAELPSSKVMEALAAAVEIELEPGALVPQVVANDLVSYIILDGLVRHKDDRLISVGALIFAESLVGVSVESGLPVAEQRTRLLRLRADDFSEVCEADHALAVELHRRIGAHLARAVQRLARINSRAAAASAPEDTSP